MNCNAEKENGILWRGEIMREVFCSHNAISKGKIISILTTILKSTNAYKERNFIN